MMTEKATKLSGDIWIMKTNDGFYPIEPSTKCKPEDHGRLNPHVMSIECISGQVLWARPRMDGEE